MSLYKAIIAGHDRWAVAESYAAAEKLFGDKYGHGAIGSIEKVSSYVQVQGKEGWTI